MTLVNTRAAVVLLAAWNIVAWIPEIWLLRHVHDSTPAMQYVVGNSNCHKGQDASSSLTSSTLTWTFTLTLTSSTLNWTFFRHSPTLFRHRHFLDIDLDIYIIIDILDTFLTFPRHFPDTLSTSTFPRH